VILVLERIESDVSSFILCLFVLQEFQTSVATKIIEQIQKQNGRFLLLVKNRGGTSFVQADKTRVFKRISELIVYQLNQEKTPPPPPQPVKELKKKEVKTINPTDVLMGKQYSQHPGNQQFRRFCWDIREAYGKASKYVASSCMYPHGLLRTRTHGVVVLSIAEMRNGPLWSKSWNKSRIKSHRDGFCF
jgi:hypothetical protein